MRLTGKEWVRGRKQQQKREKKDIDRGEKQDAKCSEKARGKDTSLSGYADVEMEIMLTFPTGNRARMSPPLPGPVRPLKFYFAVPRTCCKGV